MSRAPSAKRQRTNAIGKAAGPADFNRFFDSVSHILNVKYKRLSCSKQFEKGFDAATEVEECILGKATPAHSSFGTKKQALCTLLEMGTCVTKSHGELGREVRKVFEYESCLENTMLQIVRSMTAEERNSLVTEGLEVDLDRFERAAGGYGIFGRMEQVRKALLSKKKNVRKESKEDDEEDEEDEDDEEEGGENENQDDDEETEEDDEDDGDSDYEVENRED